MNGSLGRRAILGAGLPAAALPRRALAQQKPIRIGVLTDMAGPNAANTGLGSVTGAQLAIEAFAASHPAIKMELVQADLQLKPDVALAIAAGWYHNESVGLVTDVPLSSAAFAIGDLAKNKDKSAIFTGGASADITGSKCGPNHLHWCYDTWSMPHGVVDATVKEGGGDTVNCIKQAAEFGIMQGGQKVAGLIMLIGDVHGMGRHAAQGVLLTEPCYWNMNDATRAFAGRFAQRRPGTMPNSIHAGQYSAVMHYLKAVTAVGADKAKASGRAVIDQMKAMPTDDPLFRKGMVRADGRKIHDMHLFEVKTPAQSKQALDYYSHKRVIPAAEAFRPIALGNCPLVKA